MGDVFGARQILKGVAATTGSRYRHVVFTAAGSRRPLNLGAPSCATDAAEVVSISPSDELEVANNDDSFISWLLKEAGHSARDYRPSSLRRRLPACLRALKVSSITDARRLLRRRPQFLPLAHDALILGVTEFFRDASVFASIADHLASLLAATDGPLRVWSAGCSEGAELYSVAILLKEMNALDRCDLLGTDCRSDAIARARLGQYSATLMRGVSPERMASCFIPSRNDPASPPKILPALGAKARWRRSDALAEVEAGPWDMILCRNFAMYLQPLAAEKLWRGMASVLKPGGLLVLGKAERLSGIPGLALAGPCLYRRYGDM